MPTTCGFPNCKFRSRYRGSEDNRHFYRVPKKPAALRQRWLDAIGRTEETIVSQLRVCSGHFHDGEKRDGEVPVADPSVDSPVKVDDQPISSTAAAAVTCVAKNGRAKRAKKPQPQAQQAVEEPSSTLPVTVEQQQQQLLQCHQEVSAEIAQHSTPTSRCTIIPVIIASSNVSNIQQQHQPQQEDQRPLVALLDGRDCSVEMPVLKDVAMVAFCDAQCVAEVHEKVLNEATVALMWSSIRLGPAELAQFRRLKLLVQLGPGREMVDLQAAWSLGISVSCISGACVEETADSTVSLILNLYRRTSFLAGSCGREADSGGSASIDRIAEMAAGATRIRGQTLGLVGFGRVGTAVALRAKTFGFRVLVFDPNLTEGAENGPGVSRVRTLDELMAESDCVSLHCPPLPGNARLLSERLIRSCAKPSGFFLVNTCSPDLMDTAAVADALRDGVIRGLGLDTVDGVVGDQSGDPWGPLRDLPNVLVTPGSAFYSDQSHLELRRLAAQEVRRGLEGHIPDSLRHCVNAGHRQQPLRRRRVWRRSCVDADEGDIGFDEDEGDVDEEEEAASSCPSSTSSAATQGAQLRLNFGFLEAYPGLVQSSSPSVNDCHLLAPASVPRTIAAAADFASEK